MSIFKFNFLIFFLVNAINLNSQNLVLNSKFDEFIVTKDENNNLVYSPKFWHYKTNNKNHPIYYSTDKFLDLSNFNNKYFHPDSKLILDGAIGLNYVSIPILPEPEQIYTELRDSLIVGHLYRLSLDIKIMDFSNCLTDLITGFSRSEPDIDTSFYKIVLNINDTMSLNYLCHNWITTTKEFKAQSNEKYLVIGLGISKDYKQLIKPGWDGLNNPYLNCFIDNVVLIQIDNAESYDIASKLDTLNIGESIILDDIFYDFAESDLLDNSFLVLNQLIHYLKINPNVTLLITGYTDNIGNESYNQDLSFNRAKSVYTYLISQGLNNERFKFDGKGSNHPIASNESEIGRQKNRRVEIKILNK